MATALPLESQSAEGKPAAFGTTSLVFAILTIVLPVIVMIFVGHKADVRMRTPDATGRRRFVGVLRGAEEGSVAMELEGQATVRLALDDVERARLVPEL